MIDPAYLILLTCLMSDTGSGEFLDNNYHGSSFVEVPALVPNLPFYVPAYSPYPPGQYGQDYAAFNGLSFTGLYEQALYLSILNNLAFRNVPDILPKFSQEFILTRNPTTVATPDEVATTTAAPAADNSTIDCPDNSTDPACACPDNSTDPACVDAANATVAAPTAVAASIPASIPPPAPVTAAPPPSEQRPARSFKDPRTVPRQDASAGRSRKHVSSAKKKKKILERQPSKAGRRRRTQSPPAVIFMPEPQNPDISAPTESAHSALLQSFVRVPRGDTIMCTVWQGKLQRTGTCEVDEDIGENCDEMLIKRTDECGPEMVCCAAI